MANVFQAHRERVGRRIRIARVAAGFSHDQLGARVGTSRQHLIKLEKGKHLPGESLLHRIAEATGKRVEFFAGDDEDEEEADPVADLVRALDKYVDHKVGART